MTIRMIEAVREYLTHYDPADGFDGDPAKQKLSEVVSQEEQKLACGYCGNKPLYDGHNPACPRAATQRAPVPKGDDDGMS